jgi:hypothetical protein
MPATAERQQQQRQKVLVRKRRCQLARRAGAHRLSAESTMYTSASVFW